GAPRAIGDHGAPVSLPKLKKAYEKVKTIVYDTQCIVKLNVIHLGFSYT
ncbi:unnamed protein product, partial [Staurois parvus]